ncbi:ABC transporter permease [Paenibacillus swuensis]|uniref:ABC transporter permease n=1 Tax=Paenibacillus swuensis TaxID=1178515 RepID=A0A172TFT6_9BACL|nr:carbohydrate ABC transporter permease [Paenibacillus swuensis]ANE45737.1 ABC transporter permease [Paenibacillus swuensis]
MKLSRSDQVYQGIVLVLLSLLALVCVIPFIHVTALSFSGMEAIVDGKVSFLPVDFQLDTYKLVLQDQAMLRSIGFTAFVTVLGTAISLFVTICAAYPLSKSDLKGRTVFLQIIIFTMMFSGGMIPTYLIVKSLGLIDSVWALILPGLINTFFMLIVKTYFTSTIPDSVEESAMIDGCNEIRMLISIILPMSMPIIATIGLYYAVQYWNMFFAALLYINDPDKFTLQLKLRQLLILDQNSASMNPEELGRQVSESIKSATIIITAVPILLVYPWLQKHFVKGVMLGAVKG